MNAWKDCQLSANKNRVRKQCQLGIKSLSKNLQTSKYLDKMLVINEETLWTMGSCQDIQLIDIVVP